MKKLKSKALSLVTSILLVLTLLPMLPEGTLTASAGIGYYDLWINGVQVDDENKYDILQNGAASYDYSSNTLTLAGDITSNSGSYPCIKNQINGLTIKASKDVTVHSDYMSALLCSGADTTITGSNKLTFTSNQNIAVYVDTCILSIINANVSASGKWGFAGDPYNEKLYIKNSNVTAEGSTFAMGDFKYKVDDSYTDAIVLEGCAITDPMGGVVGSTEGWVYYAYRKDGNTFAKKITIEPAYDLRIGDYVVTDKNKTDIMGGGEASYDPTSKCLTLKKDFYGLVWSEIEGITVNIAADIKVTGSPYALLLDKSAVITGSGKLTAVGALIAICQNEGTSLTINNANLDVDARAGIAGDMTNGKLIINNSTITATGTDVAIGYFGKGITLNDCAVVEPTDASIKYSDNYYSIFDSNGKAKSVKIEPAYELYVSGNQVTSKNCTDILGNGIFSYDPINKCLSINGDYDGWIENRGIEDLSIETLKDSTISCSSGDAFRLAKSTRFTGAHELTVNAQNGSSIKATGSNMTITAFNAILNCSGLNSAISVQSGKTNVKMAVSRSDVWLKSGSAAVTGLSAFSMLNSSIVSPDQNTVYYSGGTFRYKSNSKTVPTIRFGTDVFYEISIAGTTVTNLNQYDVLGDGVFRYDNGSKTLTISGDAVSENGVLGSMINSNIDGLTILVDENSELIGYNYFYGNTTIKSIADRKLCLETSTGNTDDLVALSIYNNKTLTLDNVNLELVGKYGISGVQVDDHYGSLVINNSYVDIISSAAAVDFLKTIALTGCSVAAPVQSSIKNGVIYDESTSSKAKRVKIVPGTPYGLVVGNIEVTSKNKDNILGNEEKTFVYDPTTKTLTVSGNLAGQIFNYNIDGLTINVTKPSTILGSDFCIAAYKNTTITGSNKLTLNCSGSAAIGVNGQGEDLTLTIKNASLGINASSGIIGSGMFNKEYLVIDYSTITADTSDGAVMMFASETSGVQLKNCAIKTPTNAVVSNGGIYKRGTSVLIPYVEIVLACQHEDYTKYDRKDPTCTQNGNIEYYECKTCGKYFSDSARTKEIKYADTIIVTQGHSFSEWNTVSFDITNKTAKQTRTCSACNKTESQTINDAIQRLAGKSRYETAVEISKTSFDSAETVVLAYSMNYADALAGVPLASKLKAPILLTNTDKLDEATLAEIERLGAKNVIILGGESAISKDIEKELSQAGKTVTRYAGGTRFSTATAIAEQLDSAPTELFFVYGMNYADALSVSTVAAVKNAPIIYLSKDGELNADTAAYLEKVKGTVKNAYVIGGTGVITDSMMNKAAAALGLTVGSTITRVAGADRYITCVEVNKTFASSLTGNAICVATGADFPDALAGGVFAAQKKAPLFLAAGSISDAQASYLKNKSADTIYIFGGTGVVPDDLIDKIAKASV